MGVSFFEHGDFGGVFLGIEVGDEKIGSLDKVSRSHLPLFPNAHPDVYPGTPT